MPLQAKVCNNGGTEQGQNQGENSQQIYLLAKKVQRTDQEGKVSGISSLS